MEKSPLDPLLVAIKAGNINLVNTYIERDEKDGGSFNANRRDSVGWFTALHYASKAGHDSIVKLLILKGADVNAQDVGWNRDTPLHMAASAGYTSVVDILLAAGADPMIPQKDGATAFHYAALNRHIPIMKTLLQYHKRRNNGSPFIVFSSPPSSSSSSSSSALSSPARAAATSDAAAALALAMMREGQDTKSRTEAEDTLSKRDLYVNHISPDLGYSALHYACIHGDPKIAHWLLKRGADTNIVDKKGQSALHWAARRGYTEVVSLMLSVSPDPVPLGASLTYLPRITHLPHSTHPTHATSPLSSEGAHATAAGVGTGGMRQKNDGGGSEAGEGEVFLADVTIKDKKGQTAMDLARKPEIKQLLREYADRIARSNTVATAAADVLREEMKQRNKQEGGTGISVSSSKDVGSSSWTELLLVDVYGKEDDDNNNSYYKQRQEQEQKGMKREGKEGKSENAGENEGAAEGSQRGKGMDEGSAGGTLSVAGQPIDPDGLAFYVGRDHPGLLPKKSGGSAALDGVPHSHSAHLGPYEIDDKGSSSSTSTSRGRSFLHHLRSVTSGEGDSSSGNGSGVVLLGSPSDVSIAGLLLGGLLAAMVCTAALLRICGSLGGTRKLFTRKRSNS